MYRYAQSLVAFVAVGETGAFVKAAARLGVSPSVISHHIARLEEQVGQVLVHRSTRKLTLSENGRQLFAVAQKGFGAVETALNQIEADAEEVSGALKLAMPAFVPEPRLEARVMEFALRYPNVAMTLDYTDHRKDLIAEGYDLAIRVGKMPSSSLIQYEICEITQLLVATPGFLIKHGATQTPTSLKNLPFVSMRDGTDCVVLTNGKRQEEIQLDLCQLRVKSILAARSATLAGVGFGNLPLSLIKDDLASGQLVALLPDWTLPKVHVHAVWNNSSRRGSLINRFVAFLSA